MDENAKPLRKHGCASPPSASSPSSSGDSSFYITVEGYSYASAEKGPSSSVSTRDILDEKTLSNDACGKGGISPNITKVHIPFKVQWANHNEVTMEDSARIGDLADSSLSRFGKTICEELLNEVTLQRLRKVFIPSDCSLYQILSSSCCLKPIGIHTVRLFLLFILLIVSALDIRHSWAAGTIEAWSFRFESWALLLALSFYILILTYSLWFLWKHQKPELDKEDPNYGIHNVNLVENRRVLDSGTPSSHHNEVENISGVGSGEGDGGELSPFSACWRDGSASVASILRKDGEPGFQGILKDSVEGATRDDSRKKIAGNLFLGTEVVSPTHQAFFDGQPTSFSRGILPPDSVSCAQRAREAQDSQDSQGVKPLVGGSNLCSQPDHENLDIELADPSHQTSGRNESLLLNRSYQLEEKSPLENYVNSTEVLPGGNVGWEHASFSNNEIDDFLPENRSYRRKTRVFSNGSLTSFHRKVFTGSLALNNPTTCHDAHDSNYFCMVHNTRPGILCPDASQQSRTVPFLSLSSSNDGEKMEISLPYQSRAAALQIPLPNSMNYSLDFLQNVNERMDEDTNEGGRNVPPSLSTNTDGSNSLKLLRKVSRVFKTTEYADSSETKVDTLKDTKHGDTTKENLGIFDCKCNSTKNGGSQLTSLLSRPQSNDTLQRCLSRKSSICADEVKDACLRRSQDPLSNAHDRQVYATTSYECAAMENRLSIPPKAQEDTLSSYEEIFVEENKAKIRNKHDCGVKHYSNTHHKDFPEKLISQQCAYAGNRLPVCSPTVMNHVVMDSERNCHISADKAKKQGRSLPGAHKTRKLETRSKGLFLQHSLATTNPLTDDSSATSSLMQAADQNCFENGVDPSCPYQSRNPFVLDTGSHKDEAWQVSPTQQCLSLTANSNHKFLFRFLRSAKVNAFYTKVLNLQLLFFTVKDFDKRQRCNVSEYLPGILDFQSILLPISLLALLFNLVFNFPLICSDAYLSIGEHTSMCQRVMQVFPNVRSIIFESIERVTSESSESTFSNSAFFFNELFFMGSMTKYYIVIGAAIIDQVISRYPFLLMRSIFSVQAVFNIYLIFLLVFWLADLPDGITTRGYLYELLNLNNANFRWVSLLGPLIFSAVFVPVLCSLIWLFHVKINRQLIKCSCKVLNDHTNNMKREKSMRKQIKRSKKDCCNIYFEGQKAMGNRGANTNTWEVDEDHIEFLDAVDIAGFREARTNYSRGAMGYLNEKSSRIPFYDFFKDFDSNTGKTKNNYRNNQPVEEDPTSDQGRLLCRDLIAKKNTDLLEAYEPMVKRGEMKIHRRSGEGRHTLEGQHDRRAVKYITTKEPVQLIGSQGSRVYRISSVPPHCIRTEVPPRNRPFMMASAINKMRSEKNSVGKNFKAESFEMAPENCRLPEIDSRAEHDVAFAVPQSTLYHPAICHSHHSKGKVIKGRTPLQNMHISGRPKLNLIKRKQSGDSTVSSRNEIMLLRSAKERNFDRRVCPHFMKNDVKKRVAISGKKNKLQLSFPMASAPHLYDETKLGERMNSLHKPGLK